ncbi:helicase-exonuclease AddAB subunit AddA [Paenibacillus caui]|uniref:helicase-exonuclease AddAB subunit AddA n=1 Tax=Paenibacillus caui TaxID=2873927 RepID=UPI001CA9425A
MELVIQKPAGSYWSDDQWKAIALSGGNMLVAAAAGSGKTAVLVERIIRKITDRNHKIGIEHLLVATFTKAAAAEMRQRIREALERQLEQNESDEHVQRQLAMLGRASITTLHSFCMEVIQRYYTMIPLDPGFRIASEHEAQLLRQEVMEELFEEKYGQEGGTDSSFIRLVEWFSGERSDDAMLRLVHRLYDFSRSHPWPDFWLRSMAASFADASEETLKDSLWIQSIIQDTLLTLDGILNVLSQGKALSLSPGGPAPYAVTLEEDLEVVLRLKEAVEKGPWSSLHGVFQSASFGKLKPVRKDQTDPALQDRVKSLREEAKKSLGDLRQQLFGRTADEFVAELREASPLMSELSELVIEFGERYKLAKTAKGWLDFADLEHYCLQILLHPNSTPLQILPSDAALEYQAQYEEVLLDEYQDTNTVQETIVQLISRPFPGNRFMVGDVKQSIYRFRLAEPGLFLAKYRGYGDDFTGEGLRIDLARNFRSRREVVGAVNMLFRQIMNASVAEIDYDERAELVYGDLFPKGEKGMPQYAPELMLIDRSAGEYDTNGSSEGVTDGDEAEAQGRAEEAAELEVVRLEARAIAARIRGLLGEGGAPLMVYDKSLKDSRPAAYGDIVILLRSTSAWAQVMIQELQLEGIPAVGELNQGYFQASEVEIMLSLLQIIDNPRQDIPLASVLRSPIVGLDEEQLARIRLAKTGGSFYEAMLAWHDAAALEYGEEPADEQLAGGTRQVDVSGSGNALSGVSPASGEDNTGRELFDKLGRFLALLEQWRGQAREGELSGLIWHIFRETAYLDWVGGLAGGPQRQANLRALYDRARQYESSSGAPGLFRFLRFIDKLKETGGDFGAPAASGGEQEAVRIMTIHKSKGLEFPVVFIAGLSKMFNKQDLNAPFLMHKELGFGPKFLDDSTRVSYPTLPNLAIRRRAQMELIAEEMRILYVALTRPKDKLILVSAVKDLEKAAAGWSQSLHSKEELLPDYLLARSRCYMDWIGPALIRHASAEELRELAGVSGGGHHLLPPREDSPDWRIAVLPSRNMALAAAAGREEGLLPAGRGDAALRTLREAGGLIQAAEEHEDIVRQVEQRLEWAYPYSSASRLAAKTSVTELKTLLITKDQPAAADAAEMASMRREKETPPEGFAYKLHLRRPRFMEQRTMSPTERGTAYHTVMQHIQLQNREGRPPSAIVEETFSRLTELCILLPEQIAELDPASIAGFLDGPLGQLLQHAEWIRRELPFTYGMPAAQAYPHFAPELEEAGGDFSGDPSISRELDGETVLVQGIVDCLFFVDGRQILLDYKSDRVLEHEGGVDALKERYRVQLDLYATAVEQITGLPVAEKWLYFFEIGEAVRL